VRTYNCIEKHFGGGLLRVTYMRFFRYKNKEGIRVLKDRQKLKEGTKERLDSINRSYRQVKDKVWSFAYSNEWEWFVTLTFDKSKVDRFNYTACISLLRSVLKQYKRDNKDFEYLVVPEQHKNGAWHFHGLFKSLALSEFKYSKHLDKAGRKIYNIRVLADKLGHTTAARVDTRGQAAGYLVKYINKDLMASEYVRGRPKYIASRGLDKSITSYSNQPPDYIKGLIKENDLITIKALEVTKPEYTNEFTWALFAQSQAILT